MFQKIRKNPLFLRLRRSDMVVNMLRPIHDRKQVRQWWQNGRPSPPPHSIKINTLLHYADSINAKNIVETGAYLGDTVRCLRGRFEKIYSIEIAEIFVTPLKEEFSHDSSVEIILGDSGTVLPIIVKSLDKPTIFWLDAHHSGGDTEGFGSVPIFNEIDAISKAITVAHAIIIDDMIDFKGVDGYPTVQKLEEYLKQAGYQTLNFNNMMQAFKYA